MSRKKRRSKARRETKRGERNQERAERVIRMELVAKEDAAAELADKRRKDTFREQSANDMRNAEEDREFLKGISEESLKNDQGL